MYKQRQRQRQRQMSTNVAQHTLEARKWQQRWLGIHSAHQPAECVLMSSSDSRLARVGDIVGEMLQFIHVGLLAQSLPTTKIQGNSSIEAQGEGHVPGLRYGCRGRPSSRQRTGLHAVCSFPMLMRLLRRSPIEPELAFWVWARVDRVVSLEPSSLVNSCSVAWS